MRNLVFRYAVSLISGLLMLMATTSGQKPTEGLRSRINMNREWKFRLGDTTGAEKPSFQDRDWTDIHLPHNFSIPYFQSAHWYTGYGWYRKNFRLPASLQHKRVFIEFEGAFREAEIYVNGKLAGMHQGGYTGFSVDISAFIQPGENILAVRLNNHYNPRLAPRNGDHNFTGGIYRDVYLLITNEAHVPWYGTFVTTPGLSKASGIVNIQTEIKNDAKRAGQYKLQTDIVDPSGRIITSVASSKMIPAGRMMVFNQATPAIENPKLWHPHHPFLYKAVSTVYEGKKIVDRYETVFGFRWMKWTADSGFYLNGERYYFRGANAHQDQAGWASAVTNAALIRDIKMIRECGMDFIRGSHYPHDPSYSDACDSLGILLWQENDFWGSGGNQRETDNWYSGGGAYPVNGEDRPYFEQSVKNNLAEMIRIHRNHPSIIVWSMCNEPFFTDGRTIGEVRRFLKELTAITHQLDPTRPVAIGGSQRGGIDTLGDIAGYNGDGARLFMDPGIPNVVSEYGSTIAIRPGKYLPGWGDLQQQKFAWRSGEAIWCAFDYGTRAGDFGLMGMIDYFRLPKNMWYWYRNAYKNIPPPEPARNGIATALRLTADKTVITGTDGTDDVQLLVTVVDEDGKPLSNSPEVTLQVISGPGEFPTGRSITFSNTSDIYIRDGKAAISFRSYYGGSTLIRAVSEGLRSDSIVIRTNGSPYYRKGVTPEVKDRPYVRYTLAQPEKNGPAAIDISYQKPTRAGSEKKGFEASKANDRDKATAWISDTGSDSAWWQVDLENIYRVSSVSLTGSAVNGSFRVDLSVDGQHWEKAADGRLDGMGDQPRQIATDERLKARFLRLVFTSGPPVTIREIAVFGRTIQ